MNQQDRLRVVITHDWLTGMRGGERVLEILCRRWPKARLFTLLHRRGSVSADIERLKPRTSFLQWFPQVHRYYRSLLPLMPLAAGRWPVPDCDLLVSSSHCVAKAARAPAGVPHLCYCYTPMRYAWHLRDAYFQDSGTCLGAWLREGLLERLRDWDRRTAAGVTHFVAISQTVRKRIADCYGRDSVVIYPPVNTDYFTPAAVQREDFYLVTSALAPYKRVDVAIEACKRLKRPLVVIGTGPEAARLQARAGNAARDANIRFLGWQPDHVIRDHYRRCRALLFPGEEDFGIVPVEAMACGAPVIALGRGGATETVVAGGSGTRQPTGTFFEEQTPECLAEAMTQFETRRDPFPTAALRRRAVQFDQRRFVHEFFGLVRQLVHRPQPAAPAEAGQGTETGKTRPIMLAR
jgi:glycosyltransferase involved in cell wall biosynthesis